jgi:L-2-hydroxyglutarate oxidase
MRRGHANGLAELRRLSIEELREHEPHLTGLAGMFVRETGIVNYKAVTEAYAQVVREHGGAVERSACVFGADIRDQGIVLHTTRGDVRCRGLVNCAGLQSDRVAKMCGLKPAVQIVPFRGEYYKLSPPAWHLVKNLIYPVPDPAFPFLGVHFTRMVEGGVEAGPNAVLALARHGYSWSDVCATDLMETLTYPGFWKMASKYWRSGFAEIHRSWSRRAFLAALQRLVPEVRLEHLAPGGAGVRAQALAPDGKLADDFVIQQASRMVHVLNAPSPAATASIAIGRRIAALAGKTLSLQAL